MKRSDRLGYVALILTVVLLGWVGWHEISGHRHDGGLCDICLRPLHSNTEVLVEIGGQRKEVCCIRCAITEMAQEKKPLKVLEASDYFSGRTVDPYAAWYVDGSRKVLCSHDQMRMDENKGTQQLRFDRCAPGAYAFANRADAEAFVAENGGVIRRLAEMAPGANSK